MTLKLFDDSKYVQKERPTQLSTQQEENFFLHLAKECIQCQYSSDDESIIAADLKNLSNSDDGFTKAENLKQYGIAAYNFCGAFIDWLNDIEYKKTMTLNENVKIWAKAHNIQPKFKKMDKLKIDNSLSHINHPSLTKDSTIYIIEINLELAYYIFSHTIDNKRGFKASFEKVEDNCTILS